MKRLRINKARGFTLIELIVVVLIIGILAAIAIIGYGAITDNAREKAFTADARQLATAISAKAVQDGKLASAVAEDVIDGLDLEGEWELNSAETHVEGTSADKKKTVELDVREDVVTVGPVSDASTGGSGGGGSGD